MFLLRKLFCIHIWKWFMSFKFTFSFMLFWFQCLSGNFITRSVWWTDHLSRDYDIQAQAFWCIVLYTYKHHYGLHGTSLWNIVLHFTGQAPHTQPWEHLWGEKKNILHSQLHTYVYFYGSFCMFRRVLRAGWIRPWHSLLPIFFSFYRIVAFFFSLSMTPAANEPLEGASLWL